MLPLDVGSDESVQACVEALIARSGRLDVLINNAGYELAGAVEEHSSEEARAQFETNFFGTVRMTNKVLPFMRQQKGGHITNVSSLTGLSPIPFMGMYFPIHGHVFRQQVRSRRVYGSAAARA
jgi:short-subunit dehydrogenase